MVIDTDILIDHFHDHKAATFFIKDTLLTGRELFISISTVAEILAGMRPGEEADTEALLSLFTICPADEPIARTAGKYLNQYAARHKLDLGDALIAATASHMGVELATRNVKHYPMTDIRVIVPYERGRP
jgi:predicted nucleic acid-binding protein